MKSHKTCHTHSEFICKISHKLAEYTCKIHLKHAKCTHKISHKHAEYTCKIHLKHATHTSEMPQKNAGHTTNNISVTCCVYVLKTTQKMHSDHCVKRVFFQTQVYNHKLDHSLSVNHWSYTSLATIHLVDADDAIFYCKKLTYIYIYI
jgi:hypothetical protein